MKATLPTIHTNGTSKEMLLRGWRDAYKAANALEDALCSTEFNARDYYVREGAWTKAQAEMQDAFRHLRELREYIAEMRNGIAKGGHNHLED